MRFSILPGLLILLLAAGTANAVGDAAAGKAKSATCVACHGADGNGNSANLAWPKLAGQHAQYLAKQLANFKDGKERSSAEMTGMVAALSPEDMEDLAAFYASQTPRGGYAKEDLVDEGEKIYRGGNHDSGAAACMSCHAPNGTGNPLAGFPALAGQTALYTANQLYAFKKGERKNDKNGMMRFIAGKMTDREIEAVAQYIAGLY